MKNSLPKIAVLFAASQFLWNSTTVEVRANDSAFSGVSGTPKPMRGEHASIAMQSERILIVADAKGYSTDVTFVFRNSGGKTKVQMGFPESSSGDTDPKGKSAFLRFATFVDGRRVAAKREVMDGEAPEMEAYWLKTVEFAPHQTRHVRVAYRSPWGGTTMWGTHSALIYDFTGENWKGKVEHSDLEIRVASPGLWLGLPLFDQQPLAMSFESAPLSGEPKVAIFRKTWHNWQAQGTFMFGLNRAVPFWMQERTDLGSAMATAPMLRVARTFRIGAVPAELPQNAENPPAFTRGGVDYLSLSHLERRLDGFAYDLEKNRGFRPKVALTWNDKTRTVTLVAGAKTLFFAPDAPIEGTKAPSILLHGQYDESTLYVPAESITKRLGLTFKADRPHRLFELGRGTWTGK